MLHSQVRRTDQQQEGVFEQNVKIKSRAQNQQQQARDDAGQICKKIACPVYMEKGRKKWQIAVRYGTSSQKMAFQIIPGAKK
jgi:hypothetical protein